MDNGLNCYRRFIEGDDDGLTEIIREYKDGLILYLQIYTKDFLIAEDAVEEVFYKLAVKKPKFNEKSSFKTWLYRIGINTATDFIRKKKKRAEVSINDCVYTNEFEELEKIYIKEENKKILHNALKKIKNEYYQILWLKYFEDMSLKEIAEAMKISIHNAETLIYRARLSLKKELEKEDFSYEDL